MPGQQHGTVDRRQVRLRGSYSSAVGFVYLFNLIVGTGALAIPKAFGAAGWLISTVIICLLALFSYITVTFVLETMACLNALKHWMHTNRRKMSDDVVLMNADDGLVVTNQQQCETAEDIGSISTGERAPLLSNSVASTGMFEITDTIEMGEMATKLFNKVGVMLFYICIIIYLYGDLAIYAVAVPKTLRDVVCVNVSRFGDNHSNGDACWTSSDISRSDVYRIFVAIFTALLGPFVFFNLKKTMYLQIVTSVLRWTSFLMMIVLTVIRLSKHEGEGHPVVADLHGMTNLFGACVYAFMCHHSLPQLATPIRNKSVIFRLFAADYTFILAFYVVICFTAVFTFADINDLYTLNFGPAAAASSKHPITTIVAFQYFLALFPVFTLSSSFPIIAITLRNNLKTLFMLCRRGDQSFPWLVDRVGFPLLTIVVPIIVAFSTTDVQFLVGFTGSYAGAGIQYILPAAFVMLARRKINHLETDLAKANPFMSPFKHRAWPIGIFVWSAVCVAFVTANHIMVAIH